MADADSSTTRSRANTRARLIEASSAVFAEKGLQGATVDDLAHAAGFTRGAFYSNFSSREELFFALFEHVSEQMIALVAEEIEDLTESEGEDDLAFIGRTLERVRPRGMEWYFLHTELTLHALRNASTSDFHAHKRDRFSGDFARLLERILERANLVPIVDHDDLAATIIALFLHDLAETALCAPAPGTTTRPVGDTVIPAMVRALTRPA